AAGDRFVIGTNAADGTGRLRAFSSAGKAVWEERASGPMYGLDVARDTLLVRLQLPIDTEPRDLEVRTIGTGHLVARMATGSEKEISLSAAGDAIVAWTDP